ncbi:hypothetical protein HMPREF3191_00989 [Veillonellaceae bacterium DNF00626]|nr:hypothetical protein HMPREF3191_00989 [Veillonellaceae bacterium DNF00626]
MEDVKRYRETFTKIFDLLLLVVCFSFFLISRKMSYDILAF